MTQENDAADRAQNINDASEETTAAANESFAQDWLDAEEKERAEQRSVASRPRFVATTPDWSTFSESRDERKRVGSWRDALRDGKLRTTGVALAAFGLGFFCAAGIWRGEAAERNATDVAAVDAQVDAENAASLESGFGEFDDDSLASIDASTLRSVPETTSVDFISQAQGGAANGGLTASVNDWANNVGTADFAGSTAAQEPTANAGGDDSSWRRGVDFQRELTAPVDSTAQVDSFPTWNDLGANLPTVADVLNAPIESAPAANVAANGYSPSENAVVAQNSAPFSSPVAGENTGYAAYNGSAGYQGENAVNSNVAAPQLAGNSQNSGYNQTNGSENFAGWPTTVSVPASNFASVAPGNSSTAPVPAPNFASVAPSNSPTAPASASNFASVAPGNSSTAPVSASNFASVAPGNSSTAPVSASNFASVAPGNSSTAPVPAPNFASVAPGNSPTAPASAPNFASVAPGNSPTAPAPRAMVAQVPSENASVPAANVPATNPNLRW
ncbi:MAG: hypothetical protein J6K25_13685 [Thermoguttaceae bacterium]|nr:hypothetical protein [Thermoguttaceae bacterium]